MLLLRLCLTGKHLLLALLLRVRHRWRGVVVLLVRHHVRRRWRVHVRRWRHLRIVEAARWRLLVVAARLEMLAGNERWRVEVGHEARCVRVEATTSSLTRRLLRMLPGHRCWTGI